MPTDINLHLRQLPGRIFSPSQPQAQPGSGGSGFLTIPRMSAPGRVPPRWEDALEKAVPSEQPPSPALAAARGFSMFPPPLRN